MKIDEEMKLDGLWEVRVLSRMGKIGVRKLKGTPMHQLKTCWTSQLKWSYASVMDHNLLPTMTTGGWWWMFWKLRMFTPFRFQQLLVSVPRSVRPRQSSGSPVEPVTVAIRLPPRMTAWEDGSWHVTKMGYEFWIGEHSYPEAWFQSVAHSAVWFPQKKSWVNVPLWSKLFSLFRVWTLRGR